MNPPTAKKPHLSASSILTYTKCGEQWKRIYVDKHRIPPGLALLRGTAVHIGAEHNYSQKIESKEDLPVKDIVDRAVAAFDDRMNAEGIMLSEEEEATGKSIVVGDAKDSTAKMAHVLAAEISPQVQPVAVEQEQRIELKDAPFDLLGYIDLIDDQNWIRDIKTTGKTKPQREWDDSLQFTMYSLMHLAKYGKEANGVKIDQIVVLKKGATYKPAETHRDKGDYNALVNRINSVIKGIGAGIAIPAVPGSWFCSPKYCGFWSTCPAVNSERKAAAEAAT